MRISSNDNREASNSAGVEGAFALSPPEPTRLDVGGTPPRDQRERHREEEEYRRRLVETSLDCIKTLELDGTILSISENGLRMLEIGDASTVCGKNWATFFWDYEETRSAFFAARDAAAAGGTGRFQGYCPTTTGKPMWWDVVIVPLLGADGKPEKLLSTSRDITAQREAEHEARRAANEVRLITDAAPLLISYVDADLRYRFVNHTYEEWFGRPASDFVGQRVEDIVGSTAFAKVLPRLLAALSGERVSYEGEMPYQSAGPRYVDIELVPDRTEDSTSVRGYVAVITDITARREAELRLQFLSELSERTRSLTDPAAVIQETVTSIGVFLGLSRCIFADIDVNADTSTISMDYCADGVASIEGALGWSTFGPTVSRELGAGRAVVMEDVCTDPESMSPEFTDCDRIGIRAHITVPVSHSSRLVSVISAQSAVPRRWNEGEVALVEAVSTLLRTALEVARVQQRERNIAEQLQTALQPPPPPYLPGLSLKGHYRPALKEASVGGDFYDVFPIGEGCTALVVGDLSGKGLAAASQVATVRNMLRHALYSNGTVTEAVAGLHHILVKWDLLTGFATLFVGAYDHKERTLTYVNCGQEPGLVWRSATDTVEYLSSTGSVLGGFGEGVFTERSISLADGDVFVLFTDGVTDVGPTIREFLDVEGVADLLKQCCSKDNRSAFGSAGREQTARQHPTAEHVLSGLVAGVTSYARGNLRDDIALLVAAVEPDTQSDSPS